MRKDITKRIAFAILSLSVAAISAGQNLNSDYFLSGSFTRHGMNPALAPERGYFSMPVVGGIGFGLNSNAGASNFVYNSISYPGKLTTFMSSDVNKVEFLNSLKNVTRLNAGLSIEVLSVGFKSFGGYNHLGLKLRNTENVMIPKSLFEFMKAGLAQGIYNIDDVRVQSNSYVDFEIGHSRKIDDHLRLGVKLHFLAGVSYADVNVRHIEAVTEASKWQVSMTADALVGGNLEYSKKEDGALDLDNLKYKVNGVSGYGLATDIGVEYDFDGIIEGLDISASVTDLGYISWSKGNSFSTDPDKKVMFDGFHNVEKQKDIDDQWDKLGEDLKAMTNLYDNGTDKFAGNPIPTFRLGIQYDIPAVEWISLGELLTYKAGINLFESRTSFNIAPSSWFDASINVAFNSFGTDMGWVLNFHPKGFNFFVGSDGLRVKLSDYIPTTATSANIILGIRFPLGELSD